MDLQTARHSRRLLALATTFAIVALGWAGWAVFDEEGRAAPAISAADQRQQEILRDSIDKPGDEPLGQRFRTINARHFAGAIPEMPVLWERRLEDVSELAGHALTLQGMFGRVGSRTIILLHPDLRSDPKALDRALCHEMVHAYLAATGDRSTNHGAAFQTVLRRLSSEGAFEGLVASHEEREGLRAWLDAESARLDAEREAMSRLGQEIERDRLEVERALADLAARAASAGETGHDRPDQDEIDAVNRRLDAYNERAAFANDRAQRDRNALDAFNREVERYNLMVSYPDGLDETRTVKPRSGSN